MFPLCVFPFIISLPTLTFHTPYPTLDLFNPSSTIILINSHHIFTCTITSTIFLCLSPTLFICVHRLHYSPVPITYTATYACYLHYLPALVTSISIYVTVCYLHLSHSFPSLLSVGWRRLEQYTYFNSKRLRCRKLMVFIRSTIRRFWQSHHSSGEMGSVGIGGWHLYPRSFTLELLSIIEQ